MKIDMHTHCRPASLCAHHQPEELPEFFKEAGLDGFVLTNHCYPTHCNTLSEDLKEQAEIYVDVYNRCKAAGEKIGIKVIFGCEIKLINEPNKPEFLLYGLSQEDYISTYPMYNISQRELFDFCNEKDILMYQSHPFRIEQGYSPADMRYLHGIEIYNPHPLFDSRFDEAFALSEENSLLKSSGSDLHVKSQVGRAGMIVPDDIDNQFMLRDYLKSGEYVIFNQDGVFCKSE